MGRPTAPLGATSSCAMRIGSEKLRAPPVPLVLDDLLLLQDDSACGITAPLLVHEPQRREVPVHGTFIEFGRGSNEPGSGREQRALNSAPAALGLSICVDLDCPKFVGVSPSSGSTSAGTSVSSELLTAVTYRFSPASAKAAGLQIKRYEDQQKERCLTRWRDFCSGAYPQILHEERQKERCLSSWRDLSLATSSTTQELLNGVLVRATGEVLHEERQKERYLSSWRDLCSVTTSPQVGLDERQKEQCLSALRGLSATSDAATQELMAGVLDIAASEVGQEEQCPSPCRGLCVKEAGDGREASRYPECSSDSTDEEGESSDDDEDDQGLCPVYSESAELPSLGSALHGAGACKRCCFFPKGRCVNGGECQFCHFAHEKRKSKGKKKKKKRRRKHRQSDVGARLTQPPLPQQPLSTSTQLRQHPPQQAPTQQLPQQKHPPPKKQPPLALQLHQQPKEEEVFTPELNALVPITVHELEPAQSMMSQFWGY